MSTVSRSRFVAVAATLALCGTPIANVAAQPAAAPATTRYRVTVVRIRPEMLNEWLEVQRAEVVPALKKAGVASRGAWTTAVGNAFEYAFIEPFPSFAALDGAAPLVAALGAEGAAAVRAKLGKAVLTQRTYLTSRVNDLEIPPGDALVMRTTVRRAAPGKVQEYVAFYRAEVMPTMTKAKADGKIAGATVAVRGVGAASGEVTTTTYYARFADMDAGDPLVQLLGQPAVTQLNAKAMPLVTTVETIIRRRVANLSF